MTFLNTSPRNMRPLSPADLRHVVQVVPKDVRQLLTDNYKRLFLGGGFIREIVAGGDVVDLDLFADSKERAELIADDLVRIRGGEKSGTKKHVSKNAITVITPNRLPVQFITRWTFEKPADLVASFDFTVCQAALWRDGRQSNDRWMSLTHEDFYRDLAGRNLIYTSPQREEEAGGSLLRVLKFVRRGYRIQVGALANVLTRVVDKVDADRQGGLPTAAILDGLLREVDPLMVIDGFDVEDDHEPVPGEA